VLSTAVKASWFTILVIVGLFVLSILAVPLIPRQFFPSSDRPELMVDLTLPRNSSIHASQSLAERFDKMLKDDSDVSRWSTYVGQGAIRFYLPLDVQLPNDFFAQAVIVAKDVEARKRLHAKLEKILADNFPK
jgi:multidrug efflux pump